MEKNASYINPDTITINDLDQINGTNDECTTTKHEWGKHKRKYHKNSIGKLRFETMNIDARSPVMEVVHHRHLSARSVLIEV